MSDAISSEYISLKFDGPICHFRLTKPARRNALDAEMMELLRTCCREIEAHETARLVLLSGEGKVFCAGGDIDAWSAEGAAAFRRHWVRDGHAVFDALARLRQPVIAVLEGHVLGGGLELAACADYRIAQEGVKFGQPETGLGIIPGWSGTQRAVRRFGAQNVRRMALFGEIFTAEQALSLGIIDQCAPAGKAMDQAEALAQNLLTRGETASELTKMLINAAEGEEGERVLEAFAGHIAADSDELAEGLAAFSQKRKPDFSK